MFEHLNSKKTFYASSYGGKVSKIQVRMGENKQAKSFIN